jgi:hypothetical protein
VQHGDGMRDSLGTDRGEGTRDPIKMLRDEEAPQVTRLLDKPLSSGGQARDASGRFTIDGW